MLEALHLELLAYLATVRQLEAATDAALARTPPAEPYLPDVDVSDHGLCG